METGGNYSKKRLQCCCFLTDSFSYISYLGANILRDLRGNVKLADFGASKRLQVTIVEKVS